MTDNNVVQMKEAVASPPRLLEQAIASGASIQVIERLMGLQERWEANQARKAFNGAIAAFKANAPEILKTVEVGYDGKGGNRTSYKHEDLSKALEVVDHALAEHGLWVRFKTKVNEETNRVTVTCILGHADGHVEDDASTLSSAPDTSGSKNPVQAIGSVVTYLQRYTLKPALGLAAAKDDDGRGAGKRSDVLSSEQVDKINKLLLDNFGPKAVQKFLQQADAESVSDIQSIKYDACVRYLERQIKASNGKIKK